MCPTSHITRIAMLTLAIAACIVPAAAAAEEVVGPLPTTDIVASGAESSDEVAPPVLASKTALATTTTTAARASVTASSCSSYLTQRVDTGSTTAYDLRFRSCVKFRSDGIVQASGTETYQNIHAASTSQSDDAPQFYWFKAYVTLRNEGATTVTSNGGCEYQPPRSRLRNSDPYSETLSGEWYWEAKPYTCYFDKTRSSGRFYSAKVRYCYDVKGDGKGTLCTATATSNYLRS